jgi:antitoxin component YwqK of YwqJK toxin-antitoxin module
MKYFEFNSKREGLYVEYYISGNIATKYYRKNDILHGPYVEVYNSNFIKDRRCYKNGENYGTIFLYDEKNNIYEKVYNNNGRPETIIYFNGNFIMKTDYTYDEHIRNKNIHGKVY